MITQNTPVPGTTWTPTSDEQLSRALQQLQAPIPSTKGMSPRERADRLHAELERRIALARDVWLHRHAAISDDAVSAAPPDPRDAEIDRLRAALRGLDEMIFNDPQTIDRAGDMRALIAGVLSE